MHVIELSDVTLAARGSGNGVHNICFNLSAGEVVSVKADSPDDGHVFLRALATLDTPLSGQYRFAGQILDFSDYRHLLPVKKRIAYVAPDTAMLSNRTIRENLLFMRYYYENSLSINLAESVENLCRRFGIYDKLDLRPAGLNAQDLEISIYVKEMSKMPDLILINSPEDFIGHTQTDLVLEHFQQVVQQGLPVVFLSYDKDFGEAFANRTVWIRQGVFSASAGPTGSPSKVSRKN
jgi:ABC-type ATPase involved in cell division